MARVARVFRRRLRRESGFTLIELLVASTMMILVLVALLALFDTTQTLVPRDQERAQQIRDGETSVYQMTHELRLSYSLLATSAYTFEAMVYEGGQTVHVLYDCGGSSPANPAWGACVRKVIGADGATRSSAPVIVAFANTASSGGKPIFSYTRNSKGEVTYVAVHVEVPAQGSLPKGDQYRITYDDGFYMRNLDV